eukprot:CAMPEP_0206262500 /NCGR_PEP_ID=MMETSP0047_2-20121206/28273_1 /ASSEMBLY_ACC=CAM_ASM_000192 /TAXON_ID=195065 /ORGANISM="Chroomonas mesostigmatica_cf, Strain CCMP1168" /LENGTH=99 /DNA_ID=CAMNT_0053689889 /DNA_START=292 /DNA_END=594 /DNA_ORIENTATION=-
MPCMSLAIALISSSIEAIRRTASSFASASAEADVWALITCLCGSFSLISFTVVVSACKHNAHDEKESMKCFLHASNRSPRSLQCTPTCFTSSSSTVSMA